MTSITVLLPFSVMWQQPEMLCLFKHITAIVRHCQNITHVKWHSFAFIREIQKETATEKEELNENYIEWIEAFNRFLPYQLRIFTIRCFNTATNYSATAKNFSYTYFLINHTISAELINYFFLSILFWRESHHFL